MKDYAKSVFDRIKIIFRETTEPFDSLLLQYGMERFLYRLSLSDQCSQFILKGGILFYLWSNKKFRPTKDLDFSYYGEFDKEEMFKQVKSICSISIPEDGLQFSEFRMSDIKESHEYEGVRVNFTAWLNKTKISMQLDISTGDKITPGALLSKFPPLLGMEVPELRVYPKETVFAEKTEAMVKLDTATSRMKDIYDLYLLVTIFGNAMDTNILKTAIQTTFTHRGTDLPEVPVRIFTKYFYENSDKLKQWKAFIRKSLDKELELEEAIVAIADYVNPLMH